MHQFAGQRQLIDLEARGFTQAQICGHGVASLQQDDIARHDVCGRDCVPPAVANDTRLHSSEVLKRGYRALGTIVLR